MAPNIFQKLIKPNNHRDGARSPSPSPTTRQPTISISRASVSHKPQLSVSSAPASDRDSDTLSTGPNVTIIPPSPRTSDLSTFDQLPDDLGGAGGKASRRLHSLSVGSKPMSSPKLSPAASDADNTPPEDEVATPTPATSRPAMAERESTMRPLSHASSTGNLREDAKGSQIQHPRSATVSTGTMERQQAQAHQSRTTSVLHRTPSNKSVRSNRSSNLRLNLKGDGSPPTSTPEQRSTTASAQSGSTLPVNSNPPEDGSLLMSPIVESPTGIAHPSTQESAGLLRPSQTLPNIPSSALLAAPDADAASVYSVSSSSKKRKMFRRGSVKETVMSPLTPTSSTKSPKRKNTGLAGALAASGLAMANSAVAMPQIAPVEIMARPDRSNSMTSNGAQSHRPRLSLDNSRSPARSRQTSLSYATSDYSDHESFVSGVEGASDEDDDLDLDADIPVTGFAVASARRNVEFHEMFSNIPEGDYLIEDYGCALQREILIQGRLYISENHFCFHANIFGWITDLSIPMYDVTALDKRMTAFVIPNAIQVTTRNAKYTFTSFLSRDTTFDVMYNVWRLARPEDSSIGSQLASARASLELSTEGPEPIGIVAPVVNGNGKAKPAVGVNKVTRCACGKGGQHYPEVALDVVIPGTPEKIYNLMFTSGFIKDFMRNEQKLTDIQISDWMPLDNNPALLKRNMSYIKPLGGGLGPKQTKCELQDELASCDFDDYVSMLTTTRTPEVPSGGVFSVKTRTCITWASSVSSRICVTTQVEWTGRSFIKGIIEKSAIDGQKTYHAELDKAMRDYIHQHQSEFIPVGVDPAVVEQAEAQAVVESPVAGTMVEVSDEQARKAREAERNQRSLQWAYDTFEGAMKVAKQSTETAIELIKDGWDQSSSSTIQYFVIAVLVISNLYTLMIMGTREEKGRIKEIRRTEEREKCVQGVVTTLWEELTATKQATGGWPARSLTSGSGDVNVEIAELNTVLDQVEERVRSIRASLQELD